MKTADTMADTALRQYLDLYRDNAAAIDAHSAPALNALRPGALESLQRSGRLPRRGDEGFEKTSVEEMFAPDFGVNIKRVTLPGDVSDSFSCDVPKASTLLVVVSGDMTVSVPAALPEGVEVMSLAEAARLHPHRVGRAYGSVAPLTDSGVAFNTLLAQDGVYIHVDRGVSLDRPVQVVNLMSGPLEMLAVRRVLIEAGESSRLSVLLCDHTQDDTAPDSAAADGEDVRGVRRAVSQVVEVIAREGASVEIDDIEESGPLTSRYSQLFVRQEDDSSVKAVTATLLNGTTRNEYHIGIHGPGCSSGLYGMAIGSGRQHIDNSSTVVHASPRSSSNQLFRYVLDDNASGAFEGGIEVTPQAPFTEAYQSNNNVLASPLARMHTKPQLLIYNDEVKCSHGASTGQLDQEALFYMQTRGIPREEARTMLMQAFMVDIVDSLGVEGVRDRLRHLVERRFAGTLGRGCHSCRSRH